MNLYSKIVNIFLNYDYYVSPITINNDMCVYVLSILLQFCRKTNNVSYINLVNSLNVLK